MNYVITALICAISLVMVIFGAQNTQHVQLHFLSYASDSVPLSLVIVLATLGGALIVGLFSVLSRLRRAIRERSVRRKLESENRDLQKRIVALESEKAAAPKPVLPPEAPLVALKTEDAVKG